MMATPKSLIALLLLLCLFSVAVLGASPTSFCKCTCLSKSVIIPLDGENSKSSGRTCADCNRQFCLEKNNLPICKDAAEEEVFTTCFQRDSVKDQAVVYIFILATVGLLVYAAVKPWVARWAENARGRSTYLPVGGEGER